MGQVSHFCARFVVASLAATLPFCWCPLQNRLCAPSRGAPEHNHRIASDVHSHDQGSDEDCPCDEKGPCGCIDLRGDGLQDVLLSEAMSAIGSEITGDSLQAAGCVAASATRVGAQPWVPPATLFAQGCSLLL